MKGVVHFTALCAAAWPLFAAEPKKDCGESSLHASIARQFVDEIGKKHVSKTLIDDAHSEKAWKMLLESYDSEHCYFLQKDIRSFEPMRRAIDDALLRGDVAFGSEVYGTYAARNVECARFATNFLVRIASEPGIESKMRSPYVGDYVFSGEGRGWPETEAEREAIWRRKLRAELLERVVEADLDAEKAGGKKSSVAEIARELAEDYAQQIESMGELDKQGAFEQYMMSVGESYDPHTKYLGPELQKMLTGEMTLSFCGIGVSVDPRRTGLYVLEVLPGGPAARDGRLHVGDRIVGVGDGNGQIKSVMGLPSEKSVRMISGKKGTKVVLEVVSASSGGERKRIELVRGTFKLESNAAKSRVEKVVRDGKECRLGYIKLPLFYGPESISLLDLFREIHTATVDVIAELDKLENAGARGLVFDLRGNGGGQMLEALNLASLFLDGGPIAQVQYGDDVEELGGLPSFAYGGSYRKPMVVLIDRASASASELVSGVLQDRGRAVILGDGQTHGKGSMQEVDPLGKRRGEALVTRGFFYRVTGSSTQVKGVSSDIRLPSVLDDVHRLGEDNLPNSLPWTKVAAAKYTKDWDAQRHVAELSRRSSARLATNVAFRAHMEKVRAVSEACNRTSLPLDYSTFMERRRRDRRFGADKIGLDGPMVSVTPDPDDNDAQGMPKREKDVVLDEALNILADLVELTGGKEMPKK